MSDDYKYAVWTDDAGVPVDQEFERERKNVLTGDILISVRQVKARKVDPLKLIQSWVPQDRQTRFAGVVSYVVHQENGRWGERITEYVPDVFPSARDLAIYAENRDWVRDDLAPPEMEPTGPSMALERLQTMRPATYAVYQAELYLQRK